jgi:aldehyde dehydrogenase (NAD+)
VDIAVKAARKAFDEGPWRRSYYPERRKILNKFADLIERDMDEIASLESLNNGKAIPFSMMDIGYTLDVIRYYAGYTDKIHG